MWRGIWVGRYGHLLQKIFEEDEKLMLHKGCPLSPSRHPAFAGRIGLMASSWRQAWAVPMLGTFLTGSLTCCMRIETLSVTARGLPCVPSDSLLWELDSGQVVKHLGPGIVVHGMWTTRQSFGGFQCLPACLCRPSKPLLCLWFGEGKSYQLFFSYHLH